MTGKRLAEKLSSLLYRNKASINKVKQTPVAVFKVSLSLSCVSVSLLYLHHIKCHSFEQARALSEAEAKQTTSLASRHFDRVSELPARVKLLVLYDSLNPLHLEWL